MHRRWKSISNPYLDAIISRESLLEDVFKVKNFLMEQCKQSWSIKLTELQQYRLKYGLREMRSDFLVTEHPLVYAVSPSRVLSFTPDARSLVEQQHASRDGTNHRRYVVESLTKLLMMSTNRKIHLNKVTKLRFVLGFPPDYERSIFEDDGKPFKIMVTKKGDKYMKLRNWVPELATSTREKWVSERDVSNRYQFPEPQDRDAGVFSSRYGDVNRVDVSRYFEDFQGTAFTSPYTEVSTTVATSFPNIYYPPEHINQGLYRDHVEVLALCSPSTKVTPLDGELKRAVAVIHEFLSLTIEKRVRLEHLELFKSELRLPYDLLYFIHLHRGLFYISQKRGILTVFLREAYDDSCSNYLPGDAKHVLWRMKERFVAMAMNTNLEEFDSVPARGSAYNDIVVPEESELKLLEESSNNCLPLLRI